MAMFSLLIYLTFKRTMLNTPRPRTLLSLGNALHCITDFRTLCLTAKQEARFSKQQEIVLLKLLIICEAECWYSSESWYTALTFTLKVQVRYPKLCGGHFQTSSLRYCSSSDAYKHRAIVGRLKALPAISKVSGVHSVGLGCQVKCRRSGIWHDDLLAHQ